jgi:putative oxidoreductase
MRKLFSANFTAGAVNFSLLLLRVMLGALLLTHGWPKITSFATYAQKFADPFHVGKSASLGMAIFAEVFCSALIILGLLTRLAVIPMVILFCVIIFSVHAADPLNVKELPIHYLVGCLVILFCGPGKISVDGLIRK